jgi:hypothetical protein
MNFNILGYSFYFVIIGYITIIVGKKFHTHGRVFIHDLFTDYNLGESVNNILLVGYYLLNIGNAVLMIREWPTLHSLESVIVEIGFNVGQIVLLLAFMHYVNITLLLLSRSKLNKTHTNT